MPTLKKRDCEHCANHKPDGCSSWECEFRAAGADIISRQAAVEVVQEVDTRETVSVSEAVKAIKALPSAENTRDVAANPVVNEWHDAEGKHLRNELWSEDSLLCPVCGEYFGAVYDEGFCRRCGQKIIQKRVRIIRDE